METDYSTEHLLQRYKIQPSGGLLSAYEDLRDIRMDDDFIYTLLKTFEDKQAFRQEDFRNFSMDLIVDYLRKTHQYYMSKKLPEIEQSIQILLKDIAGDHPLLKVLHDFFNHFRKELEEHILEEESRLLPYIALLIQAKKEDWLPAKLQERSAGYSLKQFVDSHHGDEMEMSRVRQAIQNYSPTATNQTPYRILLTQLELFEHDLEVHAIMEDRVLIPRALELENEIRSR